jgi:DNA-directed RNA polymerase subunit RPC12/RpoP
MFANVTCPACQHKYWLPEGEMGSRQICPNCQSPFFAGASVAEARAPSPASASAPVSASASASAPPAALQPSYAKTMIGDSAPPIKYTCPRCKAPLDASASEAGSKKNCPRCTQRHQVPAAPPPPAPPAVVNLNKTMLASNESAPPPRPPIKYQCPNCKRPLEAPADKGGTKTYCPACNQRLQIPAAIPAPTSRNKTMLGVEESAAATSASPGVFSADGVRGPSSAATSPGPTVGPWAQLLTARNVAIGIVLLLLLLLVVPAVIRGGKDVDKEALAKNQLELERLRADIELKKAEIDRQAKAAVELRQQIDEMIRNSRAQEQRFQEERRRLNDIDDEDRRAARKKKLDQEQQQREQERLAMERKNQQLLEDAQRKLDETKRAMDEAQKKQQTIIQQPPPVVYYPPYNPYYYRPWWW